MSPPAQWTLITLSSPPHLHLHLHLALSQVTWCSIGTDVDSLSICGYGLTKLQLVISVSVSIKRMNYYFRAVDRWSWAAVVWRLHGQLCEVTGSTLWTGSQDEVRQWVILSPRSATDRPALLRSAEACLLLSERRDQRLTCLSVCIKDKADRAYSMRHWWTDSGLSPGADRGINKGCCPAGYTGVSTEVPPSCRAPSFLRLLDPLNSSSAAQYIIYNTWCIIHSPGCRMIIK